MLCGEFPLESAQEAAEVARVGRVFGLGGLVAQSVNPAAEDPHGLSVPSAQIPVLDALKESLASRIPLPTVIPEFSGLKRASHVKAFQVDDETHVVLHGEDKSERVVGKCHGFEL